MKEYFGLDIKDLYDVIAKNKHKILRKPVGKEDNGMIKMHKLRVKKGIFYKCELCEKWIEVTKECYDNGDPTTKSYTVPLMCALDRSGRWVCSTCWDIIDIAKLGPYLEDLSDEEFNRQRESIFDMVKKPNNWSK